MMKKKILSLAVVMAMLLSFMPVIAQAETSGECGENLTWTLDDEGTLTISGIGDMTNGSFYLDVPWYSSCSSIKNIIIGNSVTSIGDWVFSCCSNLESVIIGNGVTSIGNSAFSKCSSLGSVVIPDSVTSIGAYAFDECSSIENVVIPDSVTSIGGGPFSSCSSLESISVDINNKYYSSENGNLFNNDKTTLIQYAIGKTDTQYTIPDSVTSIGVYAFSECSSLESVVIPDSVTSIGYWAFYNCSSLESVTIGKGVTGIGYDAFSCCISLKSVVIPDSVTSIGDEAFEYCSSLESVVILDSVTSIGNSAFSKCSSLKSVVIPDSVIGIGYDAFWKCSSLTDVYYGGSEDEWEAINIDSGNTPLTNATIHYNSTGIPSSLDCQTQILDYSESDGKYMIKSTAKNNTDTAISCVMYSAVYSSDGTLKACGTVKKNIDAGSNKEVDISVPCTIETGDTIKTFMWADNTTPLAKAGELVIQ
ncbi:MAG: leucine-rich repeat domain-containing protein [Clostridia bacterium]|nr:leucine-rich repeat domain-containing protein [Clostridia bacterium]